MGSTSKKHEARDRLSELPDEILVHILSFLPILDAVRTLSIRRFGNLWTMISSLDFKDYEFFKAGNWPNFIIDFDKQIHCFTSFVRNVLMLHKGIPVDKFVLHFNDIYMYDDDDKSLITYVNSLMRFAIDRQVKEVEIQIDDTKEVYDSNLPQCIFTSQYLVMLKFAHCEIKCLSRVQMGSLRKLSLTNVNVSNEMFEKIISGCPTLQELVMRHVHVLDELRITAPNIEKLDLEYCSRCVLDCPNLKFLNIHLISSRESILQVVNIPSVCQVYIQSTFQIDEIVSKICTVEVVKFSDGAFQQSNFKELDIPQTRWKRLHIESQLDEDQFIGIFRVLNRSPHLEELIVGSYSHQNLWRYIGKRRKTHEHHVLSEELSSPCVIPLLKSVTIHGHKVPCQGLLQLAEFLLKSCVNLEKMVILPTTYNLGAVEELKFVKQLLSFPRASANARVTCGSEIYLGVSKNSGYPEIKLEPVRNRWVQS